MKTVEIGKIVNTRGLKGEVKVYPYIDDLSDFENFSYLLIDGNKVNILGRKYFKNMAFLTFEGIDSLEKAEKLKNKMLYIYEEDLPELDDGQYYIKDIIGLEVYTEDGELRGKIKEVTRTGSNDVYEVACEGKKSLYLPAIKDVIKSVDLENKKMTVVIIDGLDEL